VEYGERVKYKKGGLEKEGLISQGVTRGRALRGG